MMKVAEVVRASAVESGLRTAVYAFEDNKLFPMFSAILKRCILAAVITVSLFNLQVLRV